MALTGLKDSYQQLYNQTLRLSEDDLASLEFFPWQNGRPVWRIIAGNGTLHPLSYMAGYTSKHTGIKRILDAYEAVLPRLAELEEIPGWQALLQYDLACICAIVGQKKRAIHSLGASLRLSPDFSAWTQQNLDLDSLRGESEEYEALFA